MREWETALAREGGLMLGGELDAGQRTVFDAITQPDSGNYDSRLGSYMPRTLSVVGAPGSGKTYLLRQCVEQAAKSHPHAAIAVLCSDRRSADRLRNEISVQMGGLSENITVRSATSFAYSIVSYDARRRNRRLPELISGPEQDAFLQSIFSLGAQGFLTQNPFEGSTIEPDTLKRAAFRNEFRDLITRAAELELSPDDLRALGQENNQPTWIQGADVMRIYEDTIAVAAAEDSDNPDRVDHARLITLAASVLRDWDVDIPDASGMQLEFSEPAWDFVFADDVQDMTLAFRSLMRELHRHGARIMTFGNPDQATQSYRGGVAQMPALLARDVRNGGINAEVCYLTNTYRGNIDLYSLREKIASAIHITGTTRHRHATPRVNGGHAEKDRSVISAHSFVNQHEEIAYIASEIRKLNLKMGVPYNDIAVITRARSPHQLMRRSLINRGIKVQPLTSSEPLRRNRVIAALFELIWCVADGISLNKLLVNGEVHQLRTDVSMHLDVQRIAALAMSPLFSMDSLQWRTALRKLRGEEIAQSRARSISTLVEGMVLHPNDPIYRSDAHIHHFTSVLAHTREVLESGKSASISLWSVWNSLGVAEAWRVIALGQGANADQVNTDLDAMMQLFRVVQRFEEQDSTPVSLINVIERIAEQDIPEDSIARSGRALDAISLLTPNGVNGRVWKHVFIARLNEGVWPNTALRNRYTHVPELTQMVVRRQLGASSTAAAIQNRGDVIDDELRMLLQSVSRATESLTLTAIDSDDSNVSQFLQWLTTTGQDSASDSDSTFDEESSEYQRGEHDMPSSGLSDIAPSNMRIVMHKHDVAEPEFSVESLVAELRRAVKDSALSADVRYRAHDVLKRLSDAGVRAANDAWWIPDLELSTHHAVVQGKPRISPSQLAGILACPLKQFLESHGGSDQDNTQTLDFGTLIHSIAEQHPHGDEEEMMRDLDEQWESRDFNVTPIEVRKLRLRAEKQVKQLARYFESVEGDVVTEVSALWETDSAIVSGRLDRVEIINGGESVRVTDIKTGKYFPSAADLPNHPQLLMYQWLVNHGALDGKNMVFPAKSSGAQLLYPEKQVKKIQGFVQDPLTDEDMERVEHLVTVAGTLRAGADFYAKPDKQQCDRCAFRRLCPAQGSGRIFS